MFLRRSVQDVLKDAAVSIAENTPITNFSAGSIARSIVEAIAPEIGSSNDPKKSSLYDFAQQALDQGQISKATNTNLDLIGGLFSYHRRIEEVRKEDGSLVQEPISDDLYRYEITQVVPSMATANYASLRLALLAIQGVKDAIGKEYTHGTGSFSFILIPQAGFETKEVARLMSEAINTTKAFGVRPHIVLPVDVPADLHIKLAFHETTSEQQKINIRFDVQAKLQKYIASYEMGQSFIYNDLIQEVMNANDLIIDFEVLKFYLNNEPVLLMNQEILEDERIIPQVIEVI